MEYESDRDKAIAYRMHEKGYENWYIAVTLDESKETIERWIYEEDREAGMQLLALMLLEEQRYDDLKRLGDEQFRDQVIQEYEEKEEKKEETGTSEPR